MALTKNEQQVQWSASDSKTVSAATIQWSDAITLDATDFAGSVTVDANNAGTPASGDTCDVYVAYSNGDVLGDSGDDFPTDEYGDFIGRLDTYGSNSPGEDPARATFPLDVAGKKALKLGVICAQAATRNIVVRARLLTHRSG